MQFCLCNNTDKRVAKFSDLGLIDGSCRILVDKPQLVGHDKGYCTTHNTVGVIETDFYYFQSTVIYLPPVDPKDQR